LGYLIQRVKIALVYEIAREKPKTDKPASEQNAQSIKETEANVNAAIKAVFAGVNEKDPQNAAKLSTSIYLSPFLYHNASKRH